ncbi:MULTISPECIES: DUF4232 domain-containing protein [Streptomyces]|uniref:DUF4232 domain-containing protein n=1 Tax=Streptomyces doudnae TaxID=3075536 RepID=A0ABD5EY95_9ACTN|nr:MULTISPECIES: DUF4232 domain-containing protein [unclassified Streptomyces]MDT0439630.1 DUF4232 domain-containing protein [Streptomyces sp. DSM 41981]SCE15255.1 Protein of unknown function [Streptomyces sp. SolWspMP-5a-2]
MIEHENSHRTTTARTGRRTGRVLLGAAAAGGLTLALAGAGTAQAAAQPAAASTPTCAASALKATFGERLAGGMNHQGVVLRLRNLSGTTCALRGFPGVGLENAAHTALSSHTTWGDTWYAQNPGKKTLALKDGQSAEAVLAWTHANTGTSEAVHASSLRITPPASTTYKTLAFPEWVDHGDLTVTALARHIDVSG